MKRLFTILTAILLSTAIYAQIPNYSFENWSSGSPVGWTNSGVTGTLEQTSVAYAGKYAAKLLIISENSETLEGDLETANFPVSSTPIDLNFWYKLSSANGDVIFLTGTTDCANGFGGLLISSVSANSTVYKYFSATIGYFEGSCTADSAQLGFTFANSSGGFTGLSVGDSADIDDLSFTSTAGIDNVNKNDATLEPCQPNPASGVANIIYDIPSSSTVTVALYNIMGQKVETLLNNLEQTPGRYKIPIDVSNLSNGIYFYSLTVNGQTYTQKLSVTH